MTYTGFASVYMMSVYHEEIYSKQVDAIDNYHQTNILIGMRKTIKIPLYEILSNNTLQTACMANHFYVLEMHCIVLCSVEKLLLCTYSCRGNYFT